MVFVLSIILLAASPICDNMLAHSWTTRRVVVIWYIVLGAIASEWRNDFPSLQRGRPPYVVG